ncbi:hypothetical protein [Streptomyces sp. NPDC059781]|uniref:hypothetical protein n=1 Tax=unclassified Streptomyces TaxID=2593676 RepID=UPI003651849F
MRMRRVAALAAATAGLLTALSAPAAVADGSKASAGGLTACNHRAQDITVEFPLRGGFSTYIIDPGTCLDTGLGSGRASEQAVAYAHYSGGHKLAVDHFFFDSRSWYTRHVY